MKARVIVGAAVGIVAFLVFFVLPPAGVPVLISVLCAVAAYELLHSTGLITNRRILAVCSGFSVLTALYFYFGWSAAVAQTGLVLLLVYLFAELLYDHKNIDFLKIAAAFFAALLLPYMLSALLRIYFMEHGKIYVLIPLIAAWACDVCALFSGMLFGKHKLAPVISPKKTVEGAVGGVLGGALGVFLYALVVNLCFDTGFSYPAMLLIGAFGAVLGQIGDLSFSVIKRRFGIKDYGRILPGHGGILDRFDSVIFVAPIVEVLLQVLG